LRIYIYIIVLLTSFGLSGQESMHEGFELLDSGLYAEAELFFSDYLTPENKTGRICHARAVGLGSEPAVALESFQQLSIDFPDDVEVLLNLAEAHMWNKAPRIAIVIYSELLEDDPELFVANFGYANAHASLQENKVAIQFMEKALIIEPHNEAAHHSYKYILIARAYELYKDGQYEKADNYLTKVLDKEPENKQAKDLAHLINEESKSHLKLSYTAGEDLGGHAVTLRELHFDFKVTGRHKLSLDAGLRDNEMQIENTEAQQQTFLLSDEMILNKKHRLHAGLGVSSSNVGGLTTERLLFKGAVESFWSDRLYTKVGYNGELHNYTVDLIQSDIMMQNYSLAGNYMLSDRIGWYLNGIYTTQSDANTRRLVYTSLYYSFMTKHIFRVGVNYNYFGFEESRVSYFSPQLYQQGEFFLLMDNMNNASRIKFKLQVSFGVQQIEQSELQAVRRLDAMLGYHFKKGLQVEGRYLTNSAASATAIGAFSYNQWTLALGYKF